MQSDSKRRRVLVVINGYVVDATGYAAVHPGGERTIMACAGREATAEFNTHSADTTRRVNEACAAFDKQVQVRGRGSAISVACELSEGKGGGNIFIVGRTGSPSVISAEAVAAFRALAFFGSLAAWALGAPFYIPAVAATVFAATLTVPC